MMYLKKQWYLFLNWLIPSRRERLLKKIMELDQESGVYDCCGDWNECGECTCQKKINNGNIFNNRCSLNN